MSYTVEVRHASKNGYHTPAEAVSFYKDGYSRDGVLWHWWDAPSKIANTVAGHDNIVNYILSKASRGQGSIHYVVSDFKITYLVDPTNVAWHVAKTSKPYPNCHWIGVELSPHLGAQGYKKAGWLFWQLEQKFGKALAHSKHNNWVTTQCPGSIDINRIAQEVSNWKSGAYNPKPAPAPTPAPKPTVPLITEWTLWKEGDVEYEAMAQPTKMYDLTNAKNWPNIPVVKEYNKGDKIVISASFKNTAINRTFSTTRNKFDSQLAHGFNPVDLEPWIEPSRPVPVPPDPADPTTPTEPTRPNNPQPESPTDTSNLWQKFVIAITKFLQIFFRKK